MAALHEALTSLAPVDWDEVPKDNLRPYVEDILQASELILNSVPPPPNGTPFAEAKPQASQSNTATSHKDMIPSQARSLAPREEFEELQSQWGKQLKFSSKENPLEVALYKMAGKDRHGGWFARRSVHEGIGFTKFRDAMKAEFEHSLKVEGGPGAGCIRGIGADKKLEDIDVDGDAHLEVLQLSAQFPGPTTAREFISLVITSESFLSEKSVVQQGIASVASPRHFVIVSKPVRHADAPERSGYVRGQYESVELIREVPLNHTKSKSTPNLLETAGESQAADDVEHGTRKRSKTDVMPAHGHSEVTGDIDEQELNPVEWIMITRSDPGGGIPRFMIDRGTPSAMIGDVHKFLDWAAKGDGDGEGASATSPTAANANAASDTAPTVAVPEDPPIAKSTGILQSLTQTIEAGLDAYAPAVVSSFVHDKFDYRHEELDTDSSDDSDSDSFASATEKRQLTNDPLRGPSLESISVTSTLAPSETGDRPKVALDPHDKKLLEINKERDKLEKKLAKKREDEEIRLKKAQNNEESEVIKAKERYEKEVQKQEEKHRKEIAKLEAKKEKEAKKLEQKRQKMLDRDALSKVTRERDEFRSQAELLKRENDVLRQRLEHFEGMMNDHQTQGGDGTA